MSVTTDSTVTPLPTSRDCCEVSGRVSVEGGLWREGLDFCGLGFFQDPFRKVLENTSPVLTAPSNISEGSTSDTKTSGIQDLEGPWDYLMPPAPRAHPAYLGSAHT